jgi:hypothetical protein
VNSLETTPLPKNAKTDEDKRIKQQQYDSNKRVGKFQPSWKAVYKWRNNKYSKVVTNSVSPNDQTM